MYPLDEIWSCTFKNLQYLSKIQWRSDVGYKSVNGSKNNWHVQYNPFVIESKIWKVQIYIWDLFLNKQYSTRILLKSRITKEKWKYCTELWTIKQLWWETSCKECWCSRCNYSGSAEIHYLLFISKSFLGEVLTLLHCSELKAATHTRTHAHTHFLPKNRSPLKVLVVCGQGWTAGVEVDRSEQDDDADPGVACSLPSTRASRLADISPRSPSPSIMRSQGKLSPGRDIPSHTNMILYTCKHLQCGETSDNQRKQGFLGCFFFLNQKSVFMLLQEISLACQWEYHNMLDLHDVGVDSTKQLRQSVLITYQEVQLSEHVCEHWNCVRGS